MKVKLLIATIDVLYVKLISDSISEFHADKIDVSICNAPEGLQDALTQKKFDVVLIDPTLLEYADTSSVGLPLLLWSDDDPAGIDPEGLGRINKYQRISTIVAAILEKYAKVSVSKNDPGLRKANITAVWSPVGGSGKTSVAVAYALSQAAAEKDVFYLNMEDFTSVPCYFNRTGKSISSVFEMLENQDGNVKMLIQGVSCSDNGVMYLCGPDNYEDMCILSSENINALVSTCSGLTDELVIDLSSTCDTRVKKIFELADNILLVTAQTAQSETKTAQFLSQNNVFESIKEKVTMVANKGTSVNDPEMDSIIHLPYVQSNDALEVSRILSNTESLGGRAWLRV